jgi:hypothetical protein
MARLSTAAAAGTNYYATTAGAMAAGTGTGTETSVGNRRVGWTVEATRLVVRIETITPA